MPGPAQAAPICLPQPPPSCPGNPIRHLLCYPRASCASLHPPISFCPVFLLLSPFNARFHPQRRSLSVSKGALRSAEPPASAMFLAEGPWVLVVPGWRRPPPPAPPTLRDHLWCHHRLPPARCPHGTRGHRCGDCGETLAPMGAPAAAKLSPLPPTWLLTTPGDLGEPPPAF